MAVFQLLGQPFGDLAAPSGGLLSESGERLIHLIQLIYAPDRFHLDPASFVHGTSSQASLRIAPSSMVPGGRRCTHPCSSNSPTIRRAVAASRMAERSGLIDIRQVALRIWTPLPPSHQPLRELQVRRDGCRFTEPKQLGGVMLRQSDPRIHVLAADLRCIEIVIGRQDTRQSARVLGEFTAKRSNASQLAAGPHHMLDVIVEGDPGRAGIRRQGEGQRVQDVRVCCAAPGRSA